MSGANEALACYLLWPIEVDVLKLWNLVNCNFSVKRRICEKRLHNMLKILLQTVILADFFAAYCVYSMFLVDLSFIVK